MRTLDRSRPPLAARATLPVALALAHLGCGGPAPGPDAGPAPVTDAHPPPADIGPAADAPGADAPSGADGGGACAPSGGPATGGGYCDLFELGIFTFDDASPEARLYGRLMPDGTGEGACAAVDEVEVQRGGVAIGVLSGLGPFAPGGVRAPLAAGPPLAEMTARCAGDAERYGGFGLVVRGRVDGGTFEARCADAEGGARWPPALRVTCHHNVGERPFASYAMVSTSSLFSSTQLSTYLPHAPGEGATSVEASLHVIPGFAPAIFGPPPPALDPFDAAPFGVSLTEGVLPGTTTEATSVSMFATDVLFPLEICPPPRTGTPGPEDPLPPVFLARLSGTNARGAFSTEAYVDYCTTTSSP